MNDEVKELLVRITMIEWEAKDLHYRSSGEQFYALHLLADMANFSSEKDSLIEAYYLGEEGSLPPTSKEIALAASEGAYNPSEGDGSVLVSSLQDSCSYALYAAESAKRKVRFAGTHAVIDNISQKLLVLNGLLKRTMAK